MLKLWLGAKEILLVETKTGRGSDTFCLLLRPGLLGLEVGECLEIGVESWLLEPVPLAERGPRAKDEEIKQGGKGGWDGVGGE